MRECLKLLGFIVWVPISLPIEYPVWKMLKAQNYDVGNYVSFLWDRTFGNPEYKKRK